MNRGVTEASATESLIERLKDHYRTDIGMASETGDDIAQAAAELEALRSRCERMERALELAQGRLEALDGYPYAVPAGHNTDIIEYVAAARALQQGGKAE